MIVSTIGFTRTSARRFFERLIAARVKRVIDVRLYNTSQLAGFAKSDDLAYFLNEIGSIEYVHQPLLAPTDSMLKEYKKGMGDWREYERQFLVLMAERHVERSFRPEMFADTCLLCSEAEPHHCHRRLVCDYLNEKWDGAFNVQHL